MDSADERKRRQTIRETYLSYYKNVNDVNQSNTICSLNEVLTNETLRSNPNACEFLYTFVLSGNGFYNDTYNYTKQQRRRRQEQYDDINSNNERSVCYWEECGTSYEDFVVEHPKYCFSDSEELRHQDITFLNIHENMDSGKSQTWLTYAAALSTTTSGQPDFHLDYVGKLYSDTVLFVDHFLEMYYQSVNNDGNLTYVYGGSRPSYVDGKCKYWRRKKVCNLMATLKSYQQGCFYFLSKPLVQHM